MWLDRFQFIRKLQGGRWINTTKEGWVNEVTYNFYMRYIGDMGYLEEENYY